MEFGYRARLPNSVVMGISQRQPGVGAAVGAGLQQAGQVALRVSYDRDQVAERIADSEARIAERELQRRRSEAIAVNSGALAELDLKLGEEIESLRSTSAEGAPQHGQKAEELYRKRGQEFLDTLPDDDVVREFFAPRVARFVTSGISGEQVYERQRRVAHIGTQTEKAVDRAGALTYATPSFENFAQNRADLLAMIDMQDDLDGTAKAAMKDAATQSQVTALLDGLVDKGGYDAAEEALETGQFDEFIGGADGRAAYMQRIGTGREVVARQEAAAANAARGEALKGLESLEVLIDNGEVPATSAINAAIATARAAGVDQADLLKFSFLADRAMRTTAAQGLTTSQIEAQRGELQQRINNGGASAEDRRQFEALEGELKRRDDTEADQLEGLNSDDIGVQAEALARLGSMPAERRERVAQAAGNTGAAILSALPPKVQITSLRGQRVRADKPEAFLPQTQAGKLDAAALDAAFLQSIGPNMQRQLLTNGLYAQVRDLAVDYYVGSRAQGGSGAGTAFGQDGFAKAVNVIFGASQRSDGTVVGGIGQVRGRRVELPPHWSAPEFDRGWSRLDFRDARYANGAVASKRDVLQNYQPLLIGTNEAGRYVYVLQDANGRRLADANGQDFTVRVGARP